MQDALLEPGDIFGGKYRVVSVVATGGFSRVYRAVQEDVDRPVAIKILRFPDIKHTEMQVEVSAEELRQRFLREARLVSRLHNPSTITMYDFGETEGGDLYMVMEYISGRSLQEELIGGRPIPPNRVVRIALQVLESLREAHSLGILHRDIKPANIMTYTRFGKKDQVKLLDFGVAKVFDNSKPLTELTKAGMIVGTARYMSPEQVMGRPLTPASDLYSLGLVAYEMLTGFHPVRDGNSLKVIQAQLEPESFKLPKKVLVPAMLRAAINQLLNKDVAKRYQSADEVHKDLAMLVEEADDAPDATIAAVTSQNELAVPGSTAATMPAPASSPPTRGTRPVRPLFGDDEVTEAEMEPATIRSGEIPRIDPETLRPEDRSTRRVPKVPQAKPVKPRVKLPRPTEAATYDEVGANLDADLDSLFDPATVRGDLPNSGLLSMLAAPDEDEEETVQVSTGQMEALKKLQAKVAAAKARPREDETVEEDLATVEEDFANVEDDEDEETATAAGNLGSRVKREDMPTRDLKMPPKGDNEPTLDLGRAMSEPTPSSERRTRPLKPGEHLVAKVSPPSEDDDKDNEVDTVDLDFPRPPSTPEPEQETLSLDPHMDDDMPTGPLDRPRNLPNPLEDKLPSPPPSEDDVPTGPHDRPKNLPKPVRMPAAVIEKRRKRPVEDEPTNIHPASFARDIINAALAQSDEVHAVSAEELGTGASDSGEAWASVFDTPSGEDKAAPEPARVVTVGADGDRDETDEEAPESTYELDEADFDALSMEEISAADLEPSADVPPIPSEDHRQEQMAVESLPPARGRRSKPPPSKLSAAARWAIFAFLLVVLVVGLIVLIVLTYIQFIA